MNVHASDMCRKEYVYVADAVSISKAKQDTPKHGKVKQSEAKYSKQKHSKAHYSKSKTRRTHIQARQASTAGKAHQQSQAGTSTYTVPQHSLF